MDFRERVARIVSFPTSGRSRPGNVSRVTNFDKVLAIYLLYLERNGSIFETQAEIARGLNTSQSQVSKGIENLWVSNIIDTGVYVDDPTSSKGYAKVIQFSDGFAGDDDMIDL